MGLVDAKEFVLYLKEKYLGVRGEKLTHLDGDYPPVGTPAFLTFTKDWAMGELWHAENAAYQALRFHDEDLNVGLLHQAWEEAKHFTLLAGLVRSFGEPFDIQDWHNEIVRYAPEWRAIYDYVPNDPVLYFAARNFAGESVASVWMERVLQHDVDKRLRAVVQAQLDDEGGDVGLGEKALLRYCRDPDSQRKAELGLQIGLGNNARGIAAMYRHAHGAEKKLA